MGKTYITLDTRIDTFKDEFNNLVNKVGDLNTLTTVSSDSDLVQSINILDAELGLITASDMSTTASTVSTAIREHALELGTISAAAMGTSASTVSTAIAELDAEADSDRSNLAANVKKLMLDDGVSKEITSTANNSGSGTRYLAFVDGATGAQGIETDTGLTYQASTGNLVIGGELTAATLDISGIIDVVGTTNLDAVDIDGAVQIDNTVTVGVNDTGYDVKFFGDAASAYMQWDASADDLILGGAAGLIVPDNKLTLGSTAVTSTATELNLLDGVSGLVQADFTKLAAVTSSAAEINLLDGVSGLVQADFTKLAEVNATSGELNLIDGGATVGTTAIADGDGLIVNDAGTMRVTTVQTLAAYLDDEITAMPNLVRSGALNTGSITSGFGAIDIGSSTFTTTGTVNAGSITLGSAALSETELEILDGALITTAELNVLDATDTGDASDAAIDVVDADALIMNDASLNSGAGGMRQVNISLLKAYFGQVAGGTALTTIDIDGAGVIGEAIVGADIFPISNTSASGGNRRATATELRTWTNAGTLTQATQTAITRLGRLDSAQIDNIKINGNEISTLAGTDLLITPLAGQQIVLDGQIAVDAGVVTGATSITSTNFVGNVTGASASTASGDYTVDAHGDIKLDAAGGDIKFLIDGDEAASVKVAAVSSNTRTTIFTAGAPGEYVNNKLTLRGSGLYDGGTSVDYLTFDTNGTAKFGTVASGVGTGAVYATTFHGALSGNATTATNLAANQNFSITGDVTATAIAFTGSNTVALSSSLSNNAVVTTSILNDAVTYPKMQHTATANRVLGAVSAGAIGEVQVATDMIANLAVTDAKIANGTISAAKIASNTITATQIAANAVGNSELGTNAVYQVNVNDDAIGSNELKTLRTLTISDSAGTAQFIMYGAGAA